MNSLHQFIKIRNEQRTQYRIHRHTKHDSRTQSYTTFGSRTCREHQRKNPEDKSERSHQDRSQAQPPRLHRRLPDRLALLTVIHGKLDNEDSIFGRQGNEQNQPYLTVNTDRQTHNNTPQHRPQYGSGQTQYHGYRVSPTFVLGSQHQNHDQYRKSEDKPYRRTALALLISLPRPTISEIRTQCIPDQSLHSRHTLRRTYPRSWYRRECSR